MNTKQNGALVLEFVLSCEALPEMAGFYIIWTIPTNVVIHWIFLLGFLRPAGVIYDPSIK
jgi:hypothetical protein